MGFTVTMQDLRDLLYGHASIDALQSKSKHHLDSNPKHQFRSS